MSPSLASSEKRERRKAETGNSSVEEEAHTAADDSIPSDSVQSLLDEKGKAWAHSTHCGIWRGTVIKQAVYNHHL